MDEIPSFADQTHHAPQCGIVGEPHAEATELLSPNWAVPPHPIADGQRYRANHVEVAVGDPIPQAMHAMASRDPMPAETHARASCGALPHGDLPAHPIESGQLRRDAQSTSAALDPSPPQAIGHEAPPEPLLAAAAEETCAIIRRLHRRAQFCTAQRVSIGNRLLAFVRVEFLGFSTLADETTREKQRRAAQSLVSAIRKGKPVDLPEDEAAMLRGLVAGTDEALRPFEDIEEACLKDMEKLVRKLPAYAFMLDVRGFGPRSFARIIGETGPLHRYANPAKVWKRLGLAVIGGERQRKHSDAELAAIHGYNPSRRSVSWVAFDSLLKAQGSGETAGPYRQFYDHAKAKYLEREWTKLHAHRSAARYSEKKLLRDLWKAWRNELRGQIADDDLVCRAPHPLSGHSHCEAHVVDAAQPIEGLTPPVAHAVRALDPMPGQSVRDAHSTSARHPKAA